MCVNVVHNSELPICSRLANDVRRVATCILPTKHSQTLASHSLQHLIQYFSCEPTWTRKTKSRRGQAKFLPLFVHRIIRTPLFESWIRHCVVYILAYPTLISTMCFWDEHGSSGWGDIWCTSIPWLCHKSNWVQVVTIYVQKTRMRNFRREKVCATQSCIENRGSVAEEERLASPQPRLSSDLSTRTVLAAISTELQLSSRIKTLP